MRRPAGRAVLAPTLATGCAALGTALASVFAPTIALGDPGARGGGPIPRHPRALVYEELAFELPDAEAYRHVLANGVVVYIVPDPSLPLVDVAVALPVGEFLDPPGKKGLAALTAAMLRRGGAGERGAEAFDEAVDFLGAELDASAGAVRSGVGLDCTSFVLEEGLDLLFDLLRRPRFEAARLALVKRNLLASLEHRDDDPGSAMAREWSWLLFGREHFSTRPLTPADLAALSRRDLVDFHRRYWHPGNLILAVSGDVDPAAVVRALERRFAGWANGEEAPWPPPAPAHRPRPGLYHLERDIPQAKVALGHLATVRRGWSDPDFFALMVMNEMLGGGGLVSRIGGRVRTVEGLAYRAGSRYEVGDLWPGDFQIYLESKSETAALAAKLARAEVERLRSWAPSAEELAIVKRSLIDPFPLSFDTAEEIAGYFAEDELLGRPHSFWRTYRANVERVSAADVRRVAAEYLDPDRFVVLTAGRWREIEPGDLRGRASMADFYGGEVRFLPRRDPLTLAPLGPPAR